MCPYDSNGNASLVPSYFVQDGDDVLPVQHNPPLEDIAAMLSMADIRDGRAPWTGNHNANGNKLTNLAEPTNPTDAARLLDLQTRSGICFCAVKTSSQSIFPAAVLEFGTEQIDVGGHYDPATYRWTPPAGVYRITLTCRMNCGTPVGSSGWFGTIAIRKNGTAVASGGDELWTPAHRVANVSISIILEMNGTDYVDAYGSGENVSILSTAVGFTGASVFSGEAV